MIRHLIAAAIVVFFAVMATSLVRRHIIPRYEKREGIPISTTQVADQWGGKDEWAMISFNNQSLGAVRTVAQATPTGYTAFVKVLLQGGPVAGTIQSAAALNSRLELEQLQAELRYPGAEKPALELVAIANRNALNLRLSSATGVRYKRIDLPRPITMNLTADPFIATNDLKLGETYTMDVYDPLLGLSTGAMKITLAGTTEVFRRGERFTARVVHADMGGTETVMWLDPRGEPYRREIHIPLSLGLPAASENQKGTKGPEFVLNIDRLDKPEDIVRFAELRNLPPPPNVQPADVQGQDSGEPLQALGLLPMLVKNSLGKMIPKNQ